MKAFLSNNFDTILDFYDGTKKNVLRFIYLYFLRRKIFDFWFPAWGKVVQRQNHCIKGLEIEIHNGVKLFMNSYFNFLFISADISSILVSTFIVKV